MGAGMEAGLGTSADFVRLRLRCPPNRREGGGACALMLMDADTFSALTPHARAMVSTRERSLHAESCGRVQGRGARTAQAPPRSASRRRSTPPCTSTQTACPRGSDKLRTMHARNENERNKRYVPSALRADGAARRRRCALRDDGASRVAAAQRHAGDMHQTSQTRRRRRDKGPDGKK